MAVALAEMPARCGGAAFVLVNINGFGYTGTAVRSNPDDEWHVTNVQPVTLLGLLGGPPFDEGYVHHCTVTSGIVAYILGILVA